MIEDIRDQIEELEAYLPPAELPVALEKLATEMEPGERGRAEYLASAGEWWALNDRPDEALRCHEAAVADGGETTINAKASLIGALFDAEDQARAEQVLAELRREAADGSATGMLHEYVGESLEHAGRLEEAHRWFSAGLGGQDPAELDADGVGCLLGRYRVRRAMDLPEDRYDEAVPQARERLTGGLVDRTTPAPYDELPSPDRAMPETLMYWPAEEFARFVERWPDLAEGYGGTPDGHRRRLEQVLRDYSSEGIKPNVGAGSLDEYLDLCARSEHDPAHAESHAWFAAELGRRGRVHEWPPGRNEPCWCGSGVKYKRCCRES